MKKTFLRIGAAASFICLSILPSTSYSQSVGINYAANSANSSALLDVDAGTGTKKGILIPRIALASSTDASTISTPATSLLVYNTGTGGLSPAAYYWNSGTSASPVWVPLLSGGSSATTWLLTGNGGTTPSTSAIGTAIGSGQNYVGSTDAKDFVIGTNNLERIRVASGGNVGIGTISPQDALHVVSTIPSTTSLLHPYRTGALIQGDNGTFGGRVAIHQAGRNAALTLFRTSGSFASPTALNAGDTMAVISFGGWDGTTVNSFYAISAIATQTWTAGHGASLTFNTPKNNAGWGGTEKMRITSEGYVGIGMNNPSTVLEISSDGNTGAAGSPSLVIKGASNKERIQLESYGSPGPVYCGVGARGTVASPTQTQANDLIAGLGGRGFDNTPTMTGNVGLLQIKAVENFTSTAQGTYFTFNTTDTNTITRSEKMRLTSTGRLGIGITLPGSTLHLAGASAALTLSEDSSTPSSPASGSECRMYMKSDKLVIQYNDGGTVRYKYLDLTGTSVTWVQTTTAP